ncbi:MULTISPECIES: PleD family two-component system response regulator [unclassified Butyrivibrio]|uniref:response regulator n=1 Tax=unclassified Butyrivibrio TaxID=2639466 RepID=UPI0003B49404|nr:MULTISPECIES: response regulator [unclassified Butyrivibrio]SDB18078.1 Response regulator receiver domain-containing protein [Butyrivibrio sp. INlla16]SEK27280.1 Response regulator receiver domain-containing protein [Butyrivibrio sp. ob235]
MDKRVLLVGGKKSFMVTSIEKELKAEDFEVIRADADVTQIERMEDKPSVYLIYVDDIDEMLELFVYLKDKSVEDDISISVIGSSDELEKIYSKISQDRIAAVFERPVNVKELGSKMTAVVQNEEVRLQKKKILVVDDDGTMLRTIKSWLSEKYQVFMVNSGMNAITFLAKNKVDLILLDYEMPVITGPKVLEMLRSESGTSDIPVMFLTVKNDKESVAQVISLKPEKYLLKTMPPADLIANIDEFFEKQKIKNYK